MKWVSSISRLEQSGNSLVCSWWKDLQAFRRIAAGGEQEGLRFAPAAGSDEQVSQREAADVSGGRPRRRMELRHQNLHLKT